MSNLIPLRRRTRPQLSALHTNYAHMNKQCPNCYAPAGDDCRRADGNARFLPCVARLRNNNPPPGHIDETPLPPKHLAEVHDFSEPRHQEQT